MLGCSIRAKKCAFLDGMLKMEEEEADHSLTSECPRSSSFQLPDNIDWDQKDSYVKECVNAVPNFQPKVVHSEQSASVSTSLKTEEKGSDNISVGCKNATSVVSAENSCTKSSLFSTEIPKEKLDIAAYVESLTVRELQEKFKITFGRETFCKDKTWLRRRLFMGLTNQDNEQLTVDKVFPKIGLARKSASNNAKKDTVTCGIVNASVKKSTTGKKLEVSTHLIVNGQVPALHVPKVENSFGDETTSKRVRKPNRRYIEEYSETDYEQESKTLETPKITSFHCFNAEKKSNNFCKSESDKMSLVYKKSSHGIPGIQIPLILRVESRCMPKKCNSLSNLQGVTETADISKPFQVSAPNFHRDGVSNRRNVLPKFYSNDTKMQDEEDKDSEELSTFEDSSTTNSDSDDEEQTQGSVSMSLQRELNVEERKAEFSSPHLLKYQASLPLKSKSLEHISDIYVKTVDTSKSGAQKKNHRSWTLSEVLTLVEGVSRLGVGRWSDIRKVSFPGGFRSSVDLKDKWRNLLRASYSQLEKSSEGWKRRRQASSQIPTSILVRVRELYEMHSKFPAASCPSSSLSRYGKFVSHRTPNMYKPEMREHFRRALPPFSNKL